MNTLRDAVNLERELVAECQRYREDTAPLISREPGYFTFTLYYHLDKNWGQRVVTLREAGKIRDIWVFPRESLREATRNHFETLQQAVLDYQEASQA